MADLEDDYHALTERPSGEIRCPKCSSVHGYSPYSADEMIREGMRQVYPNNGGVKLLCFAVEAGNDKGKCSSGDDAAVFAFPCGHLICQNHKDGSEDCNECVRGDGSREEDPPEVRYSHHARAVFIKNENESCPICLESSDSLSMVAALSCGHLLCVGCFQKLGGRVGNGATLSVDEETRRRDRHMADWNHRLRTVVVTDMIGSLRSATQNNDATAIEAILNTLSMHIGCDGPGEPQAFMDANGVGAVAEVINRFPRSPVILSGSFTVLGQLFCPRHVSRDAQMVFGQTIIRDNPGVMSTCVEVLTAACDEDATAPMFLQRTLCHFLEGLYKFNKPTDDVDKFGSMVRAAVSTITGQYSSVPSVAYHGVSLLLSIFGHCAEHSGSGETEPFDRLTVDLRAPEAILALMKQHADREEIQGSCIGALCHISFGGVGNEAVRRVGGIECVCEVMQRCGDNFMIQRNGCNFLWSMGNCRDVGSQKKDTETALISSDAVLCIRNAMTQYQNAGVEDAGPIETAACSALGNLASKLGGLAVPIVRAGCVEAIACVLELFGTLSCPLFISLEATRAVLALSSSGESEVRLALVTSNIIPALQKLSSELQHYCMSGFGGMAPHPAAGGLSFGLVMSLDETVGRVLDTAFGVRDISMMGDDDYDFDDDEPEDGDIEDPPFDVTRLFDKDLSADDADGWYKGNPFRIDFERSDLLAKRHDKSFLVPPKEPEVGTNVCLRVSLPLGGRGYLYGALTGVAVSPTDEELRESGSQMFEKPCPCPKPNCPMKNGTREEILNICGAVKGQKCTARMKLDSPYSETKLRFEPLPKFFMGNDTQYDVVLQWDEGGMWEVISISKVEN